MDVTRGIGHLDVVEQSCVAKMDEAVNEDVVVCTADFVAVIDGATDKSRWRSEGRTSGQVASAACAEAVRELPFDADVCTAVTTLSAAVAEASEVAAEVRPSAAVAVLSRFRREVWRVGDVALRLLSPLGEVLRTDSHIDEVAAAARAAYLHARLLEGATKDGLRQHDTGRELISPLLARQHRFQNSTGEFGYGVIDGTTVPRSLVQVTALPDGEVELALASDGYPHVGPTLADSERWLADALVLDPLCIDQLRGTKGLAAGANSFDDRAYVRVRLS